MTEDRPMILMIIEKLLGLTLIIIGALVAFNSTNPPPGDISQFPEIFTLVGIVILVAGVILLIVKTK
jgi:hypothetical protein